MRKQRGKRGQARNPERPAPRQDRPSSPPERGRPDPSRTRSDRTPGRTGREEVRDAVHVVYGRNPVREALRAGRRRVHRVLATPGAAKEPFLAGARVEVASPDAVAVLAGSDGHQGLCAEVDPYPYVAAAELLTGEAPLLVALDEVQDPQNLGAIARSAECAGAGGLVLPERRSADVTAAAAKASAGAVEHLRIARVRNLADFLAEAKRAGLWAYGADAAGTARYDEPDYTGGVVLVVGAEGKGIRPRVAAACDALVAIPLSGRIDSLNVSAASAILLFEISRCRGFA